MYSGNSYFKKIYNKQLSKVDQIVAISNYVKNEICTKYHLESKKIKVRKGLLEEKVKNFYSTYFFNRKKKLPYVTGKIAVSKNNLILALSSVILSM